MRLIVRPAILNSDSDCILRLLSDYLNPGYDRDRFEWQYRQSPFGQAYSWIVEDVNCRTGIGIATAFPRRIYVEGAEKCCWALGDFCLDAQYRSLGPALELQRVCLSVLESNQGLFCYDFPSASMVAVYKRLGFNVTGKMLRLAKPLGVDRKVKEMIKNAAARRVVTSVGNALLKRTSPRAGADESLEVAVHAQLCGEEFTLLAQEQRGKFGLCLDRSAEYLNWRYISNPLARHEIVTARRNDRLVGYVVWTRGGEDASIVDFFGEDDAGMARRLVAEIATLAQDRGVMTLSVSLNESHPWLSLFC
jgi:GNAT superfamily N-acetyltransferase